MSGKEASKALKSILSDITNTQRIIVKSEEVKKQLEETGFANEEKTKTAIDRTRDIIDELTNEVLDISATFYELYDRERDETEPNETLKNVLKELCGESANERENSEENSVDTDVDRDIIVDNNNEDSKRNDKSSNSDSSKNKQKENNKRNKGLGEQVLNSAEQRKDSSPIKKDRTENGSVSTEITTKEETKTWLRCVDISKLIDPETSNSNNNNTSVVVLSDSDSSSTSITLPSTITITRITKSATPQDKNTPTSQTPKNINMKTPTKGVLKTPTSETPNSKKKKSVTFRDPETSDIEDKSTSDISSTPRRTTLPPRKTRPLEVHDISSLSEDSSDSTSSEEITRSLRKSSKWKGARRSDSTVLPKISAELDAKFSQKCVIRLVRVHPNRLKRNYEKLLVKNEIKRLTDMHSLKRTRKERHNSSSSDNSSASERERKRSRTEKKQSKPAKDDEKLIVSALSDSDLPADTGDDVDPLDATDSLAKEQSLNSDLLTDDNHDALSEQISEDLLENLGNESQDKSSDNESSSVNDEEATAKKKKTVPEEEKTQESDSNADKSNTELSSQTKTAEGSDKSSDAGPEDKTDDEKSKQKDKEKAKWRRDKLLTEKLSSSSESDDSRNKKSKKNKEKKAKTKDKEEDTNSISDESDETEERGMNKTKKRNDGNKGKDDNGKEDKSSSADDSSTEDRNKKEKEKESNNTNSDSSNDSDIVPRKKISSSKKKKADESDTDETFAKFIEKSDKLQEKSDADEAAPPKKTTRSMKKRRRAIVNSDSDSNSSAKSKSDSSDKGSSNSSSSDSDNEQQKSKQPTKRRRRIKKVKDSSDEDGENNDKATRKHIRKVWARESLAESTIAAEKEEAERKARLLEKQKKYNQIFEPDSLEKSKVDKVVLDFEDEKELLVVHKGFTKHLKPHQAKGVQFMWNTCFESVERAQKDKGSGCILAHCMGLGKTLQVITLIHTLLSNREKTKIEKVLVVCPLSTVLNWVAEFKKWLPEDDDEVNVFDIVSFKQNIERLYQIKEWDRCGGVLVLGYDMFRNLTNPAGKRMNKKMREGFHRSLVDPGPDLVICDEGHLLKNEKTSLSIAMNRLKTVRRIVLTGTPLQNNLKEYWCMVQFVKANLLGTYKEYLNRFVNPIVNGQYTDSTQHDIQVMRKRSHVLHKLLDGVVQRKDYAVLAPFLPPKCEYVLFVTLTEKQVKLYEYYMNVKARRTRETSGRTPLFVDFQELQRICTHPRVLLDKSIENKRAREKKELEEDEEESEGSLKDFIDDETDKSDTCSDSSSSESESSSGSNNSSKKKNKSNGRRITRAAIAQGTVINVESETENEQSKEPDPLEWWREFVTDEDLDNILIGGKLTLLFEILRHCESIGDKVLIFSQSLYSLNVIEYFLSKIDDATQNSETGTYCGFSGSWSLGLDYFRLDGSSSCDNRAAWCNTFNNPENVRARLFLISTRAGGLGINLVAANRVIIFDVSWNPSHDTQSIYRVYRFGQNKPSYIYRFVTLGTMEMKIYERQVIKQAISKRVIDEQQIDRHYNQSDIAELYQFEPKPEGERPIPLVPTDILLGELLQQDQKIYKYHEHQSLLENKEDEVLDEEERKAAWEEFENEKKARQYTGSINHIPIPSIVKALTSIMNRESPALTSQMIQELIPSLLQELQEKMTEGDNTLYNKVLKEIRLMQATAQQQRIEEYYRLQQQQQQNLLLQQYQQQLMINPAAASQLMNQWNQQAMAGFPGQTFRMPHGSRQPQFVTRMPAPPPNVQRTGAQQTSSTDVIELND